MMRMAFRRRAEQRTNYRRRLRMLSGRKIRIVIRKSLNSFSIQMIQYRESGDQTVLEVSTKHLRKYGWKGHGGSIPSAYLTGLLFGKTAAKKGFTDGVLDIGFQSGPALFAAAAGIRDAGIDLPLGAEIREEQVSGKDISAYAKLLKEDAARYRKQFGAYIAAGLDPEKLPEHFEETKKKIEES